MANLRVGLIGLGMMGRHHARVLRELDGVDLVAVADAVRRPARRRRRSARAVLDVEELIAAGHRHGGRRRPHADARGGRRWRWPRPASTPWSRSRSPHSAEAGQRIVEAFEAAGPGRRGRPHRALQPGAAVAAEADRSRRARRRLPDRHPPPGSVPVAHRRRRRREGPGHARHRPDRLGRPEPLRDDLRPDHAHAAAARTRTWSRRPGSWPTASSPTTW